MMETNYGVGISNRYNLFLDEDADPLEILKLQEEEKKKEKEKKPAAKDTKGKPGKAPVKKTDDVKKVVRPVAGLSENNRGDLIKPGVDPMKRDENRNFSGGRFENRDEGGRGGRGGFRGRGVGGFRGRGRGAGYADVRGKREYERHSGTDKTGIKAVDKRDGGGAHNWGRATDDYENAEWAGTEDAVNVAPQAEPPKPASDEAKESPEGDETKPTEGDEDQDKPAPTESEEKQFTLEEWKALQEEKRARPTYKLRQAGEGEDPKRWKNTIVLKKKEKESDEESEEEDDEDDDENEEEDRNQSLAKKIQFVFASGPARRGGRGRGGRGGRGGGGRPPFEGERPARNRGGVQAAPRVDDENDFPSL